MATSWRPFTISPIEPRIPPLLISTSFTADSYTIYLTDLTHLWCEDADRRSILRRSLTEDTSIDPSEDSRQFKLFLENIQLGLEGGRDVDLLISLGSHATKESATDVKNLDINLSIGLPKPLQPLNWTIKLVACPQNEFATYFTVPLLYAHNARLRELDSLVGMLRDKDNVIQKLVDKLEATGADLGQVFPGASGKGGRKIPRRAVEEKVKGLRVFEQDQWYNSMKDAEDGKEHVDVQTIIQSVFTDKSAEVSPAGGVGLQNGLEIWWERLRDGPICLSTRQIRGESTDSGIEGTKPEKSQADLDTTEEEDNDGGTDNFQVAATPPPQQASSPRGRSPPSHKSTRSQNKNYNNVDDSDDLGGTTRSHPVRIRDSFAATRSDGPAATKKLGAIGGTKTTSKPAVKPRSGQEPESETEHRGRNARSKRQESAKDNETETEDEHADVPSDSATPHKALSPKPTVRPTKKRGIGKIGGKKHEPSPARESSPKEGVLDTQETKLPTKAPKSKLGHIGNKDAKKEVIAEEEPRGRQDTKEEEKPRETSEERAQRKREELKRELEERAKAPAKKRRKF